MHLLTQVRITDQAPNQKRTSEGGGDMGLGGFGGAGPEGPPNVTEKEPARLRH